MSSRINVSWRQPPLPFPPPQVAVEEYGTGVNVAGNTTLQWILFRHSDVPRPMGLVLHIGEYKYGSPGPRAVARDLYFAGYNAAAVQYRLADPGYEMRGPHGNQAIDDHGFYPEQTDDTAQAVSAAAAGSTPFTAGFVTGEVFCVGGSAGASHAAHMAGAGLCDASVCLSGGYNFQIDSPLRYGVNPNDSWRNYVGCTEGASCDDPGGLRDLASPYQQFSAGSSPVLLFCTDEDTMPPGQWTFLVDHLTDLGATFQSRMLTETQFQSSGQTRHAFQYWHAVDPDWPDEVQTESIAWLQGLIPPP